MKNNILVLSYLVFVIISQSCAPLVKSKLSNPSSVQLPTDADVHVVFNEELIPKESNYVGLLKVGDTGFSVDCGYSSIMDLAREEAKRKGANIIAITKFKKPNMASVCYRIKAKLYRNDNPKLLGNLAENLAEINKSTLPKDADYAVIHFYRPRYFPGSAIGYTVKLNEGEVVGKIRNGSFFTYKTTDFGPVKFWSKDKEEYISLDIQPGQEYFMKCTVKAGFPIAQPDMFTIENEIGRREYKEM